MKITTLTTLSAVGPTESLDGDILGVMVPSYPIQCVVTGDPTAITVDIEGSLNGSDWSIIGTHTFTAGELTALSAMFSIVEKPSRFIRANLATLTFTTAATVSITIAL